MRWKPSMLREPFWSPHSEPREPPVIPIVVDERAGVASERMDTALHNPES